MKRRLRRPAKHRPVRLRGVHLDIAHLDGRTSSGSSHVPAPVLWRALERVLEPDSPATEMVAFVNLCARLGI